VIGPRKVPGVERAAGGVAELADERVVDGLEPAWSVSDSRMVNSLGDTVLPETPMERRPSISRTMRRPSSTGRTPLLKTRENVPSTMRSSRLSKFRRPTVVTISAAPRARFAGERRADRLGTSRTRSASASAPSTLRLPSCPLPALP
jgi:hypothetical protein